MSSTKKGYLQRGFECVDGHEENAEGCSGETGTGRFDRRRKIFCARVVVHETQHASIGSSIAETTQRTLKRYSKRPGVRVYERAVEYQTEWNMKNQIGQSNKTRHSCTK